MKKAIILGTAISYIILLIAVAIMGIKIFDSDYNIVAEGCMALICLWVNCTHHILGRFKTSALIVEDCGFQVAITAPIAAKK